MPCFYKEIFETWFDLKADPTCSSDVLQEVISYNKNIQISNKPIFIDNMH